MELTPNERCPGLQYLDDVDKGGVADMAGLQKGDYLLAVSLSLSFFFKFYSLRLFRDLREFQMKGISRG